VSARSRLARRWRHGQRGAAAIEFALLLPLLVGLLAGIVDMGVALNTARTVSSNARGAARQGAALGDHRNADHAVLLSLSAGLSRVDGTITDIVVYRASAGGTPPPVCFDGSVAGLCNHYEGTVLDTLDIAQFTSNGPGTQCAPSAPDAAWCPLERDSSIAADDRLGVAIRLERKPLLGNALGIEAITRSAVFRLEEGAS